jgi:ubiquinone/menaquinone biosynthesis C-methylase UbiE
VAVGRRSLRINKQAETGFGRAAEAYDRGRPEYPAEAISWLADRLALGAGRAVVDVGAGTGKLTRALAPTGARVVAVEPVAEMRAVLERRVPEAEVLSGQAEAIPLPDASVDAIVAGQAFHWFDGTRALREFDRVLRPGGRLGLIWNRRDGRQPLHQAIDEIIGPHRGTTPAYGSDRWADAFKSGSPFALADQAEIPFAQALDADGFIDRLMSISFVAALDAEERRSVEERLRALADAQLEPLRYTCQVFVYGRAAPGEG